MIVFLLAIIQLEKLVNVDRQAFLFLPNLRSEDFVEKDVLHIAQAKDKQLISSRSQAEPCITKATKIFLSRFV